MRIRQLWFFTSFLLLTSLLLAACGGNSEEEESDVTPTATDDPNITPTLTPTITATFRPVFTLEPTATWTPTPTATPTATPDPNLERERGTVIIGTTEQILSLDPADAVTLHDLELLRNVNLGLMTFEPGTADITTGVAANFPEVDEEGLIYTFTLESGWEYPDGTELVAGDFVRGVNRSLMLGGAAASTVTTYVQSVEAPDDETIVFTLLEPVSYFPQVVTGTAYMPIQDGQYPDNALDPDPASVYGVGPYQITGYTAGVQAVLELNPNYAGTIPAGAPELISMTYFDSATQLGIAIENNEIDIAWRELPPIDVARLADLDGLVKHDSRAGGTRSLLINHDIEPFDDPLVRQAMAQLVDRDEIIALTGRGQKEALFSVIPPGFPGAEEPFEEMYGSVPSAASAEALLTEAGFTIEEPLTIDVYYPTDAYGPQTEQAVQLVGRQLASTPLTRVQLVPAEGVDYFNALLGGEYAVGYLGWFYTYPDSNSYIEPFALSTSASANGTNYDNEDMDELLLEAITSTDQERRAELYAQAQELYATDVVTIPLTFETEFAVYGENINDMLIGPTIDFNYEYIVIAE